MPNDEQAIRNLIETWCRETEAGNWEGVLPLMADDVVFLTPGRPPFGKEEFEATGRGSGAKAQVKVKADVQEIRVAGDWAYAWLKLAVSVTPEGGAAIEMGGHTLGIYRCEGGRWLLARDANLVG